MRAAEALLFGTAGIPISSEKRDSIAGIKRVRELGLDAMELEFVRGVRMKDGTAKSTGEAAGREKVLLTAHAPYFINLASEEPAKLKGSIDRIVRAGRILHKAGGYSLVFHAGFFQGRRPEKVRKLVRAGIKRVCGIFEDEGIDIWVRPETTGKKSQFSGLKDLLSISEEFETVMPCIDFAHLHARSAGKYNTYGEFRGVLEAVERSLGREGLMNMHIHASGIEYSDKGEIRHLPLEESDMNWKDMLRSWHDFGIKGVVISESPLIEKDALLMKNYYLKIQ